MIIWYTQTETANQAQYCSGQSKSQSKWINQKLIYCEMCTVKVYIQYSSKNPMRVNSKSAIKKLTIFRIKKNNLWTRGVKTFIPFNSIGARENGKKNGVQNVNCCFRWERNSIKEVYKKTYITSLERKIFHTKETCHNNSQDSYRAKNLPRDGGLKRVIIPVRRQEKSIKSNRYSLTAKVHWY